MTPEMSRSRAGHRNEKSAKFTSERLNSIQVNDIPSRLPRGRSRQVSQLVHMLREYILGQSDL